MDTRELDFSLLHVGINTADENEGYAVANLLSALFGFEQRDAKRAVFVNEQFEVMKLPFRGKNGHIGISTSNIVAAREYLEEKGFPFDDSSCAYDEDGNLRLIYAKNEIGGFAIHLSQKK